MTQKDEVKKTEEPSSQVKMSGQAGHLDVDSIPIVELTLGTTGLTEGGKSRASTPSTSRASPATYPRTSPVSSQTIEEDPLSRARRLGKGRKSRGSTLPPTTSSTPTSGDGSTQSSSTSTFPEGYYPAYAKEKAMELEEERARRRAQTLWALNISDPGVSGSREDLGGKKKEKRKKEKKEKKEKRKESLGKEEEEWEEEKEESASRHETHVLESNVWNTEGSSSGVDTGPSQGSMQVAQEGDEIDDIVVHSRHGQRKKKKKERREIPRKQGSTSSIAPPLPPTLDLEGSSAPKAPKPDQGLGSIKTTIQDVPQWASEEAMGERMSVVSSPPLSVSSQGMDRSDVHITPEENRTTLKGMERMEEVNSPETLQEDQATERAGGSGEEKVIHEDHSAEETRMAETMDPKDVLTPPQDARVKPKKMTLVKDEHVTLVRR